jgi:subtilisin family serine protease
MLGRFLIAPRLSTGAADGASVAERALADFLEREPDVTVVKRIGRPAQLGPSPWAAACPEVTVVEMSAQRAAALARSQQILVEPDLPLTYTQPAPLVGPLTLTDPALAVGLIEPQTIRLNVRDTSGAPVQGALVTAVGMSCLAQGLTGTDGGVTLTLTTDTRATVRTLVVRPAAGCWGTRVDAPRLSDKDTTVVVTRLAETFPDFPDRQLTSWGIKALRLHETPPTHRGHGVKIAILDSGVAATHPELKDHAIAGRDLTSDNDRTWETDATGHGTAIAGIIGGEDHGTGITGIAADAELHAVKCYPGGYVSDLLTALGYCIEHAIDLAHISLGTATFSELVAAKITDAAGAGVACIAGAGDHAGSVSFPGVLPVVFTVGALGQVGQYPPSSIHALHMAGPITASGYYLPGFTSAGPAVDACAPGVAIPTTVPGERFAVYDGTAVAAAHVTGLAALVLAHHDDFRTRYATRNAGRVSHLFNLIRASCQPLAGADPNRTGAGIPDAPRALGLATAGYPTLGSYPQPQPWPVPGLSPTGLPATGYPIQY